MKRWRPLIWLLVSVACFVAALYFWRLGDKWQAQKAPVSAAPQKATAAAAQPASPAAPALESTSVQHSSTAPIVDLHPPATNAVVEKSTNFLYRLSNTAQTVGELSRNPHGILLENALIDSSNPLNLSIPDSLRAQGDPGAYIVQAHGPITSAFRAQLTAAGATIVSYIPNNAYLVTGPSSIVPELSGMATVLPWEPYYKVKAALMPSTLDGFGAAALNVAVFPNALPDTITALNKMGITVAAQSPSPFGSQLILRNIASVAKVAGLPGIEEVEPFVPRQSANDLTRVIMGETPDVFTPTNYLNLYGSNVTVAVVDSWVPTNSSASLATLINPDLTNILAPANLFPVGIADFEGHATHVAGIIAANGMNSPSNAIGSPPGANFRGKAPASTIWALPAQDPLVTDAQLQQQAATNALISNNSWGYGDSSYDLAAADYDQAVRDSIPGATGSQSLVYVFAAGNEGNGGDDGLGGVADSLLSPAVAKNVISVGASELPRNITNQVTQCDACATNGEPCNTNSPWQGMTDSADQVARFSSRGNVGIGVEGNFGRFKPDVIAPGTFVVSTRSGTWDTNAYDNPVTIDTQNLVNRTANTNGLFKGSVFVNCDATQLVISAVSLQPPNLDLPIFVRQADFPTTSIYDAVDTNVLSMPPDHILSPVDTFWNFGVENSTNHPIRLSIFTQVIRTNENGNYFQILQGMNDALGTTNSANAGKTFYRYESGTSMAAPAVSGTLALMEDYFTNQWKYTPSPALMKALLINGARSINSMYDFEVQNTLNIQGWGLVNITNSLPLGITNVISPTVATPMFFVDQSPTNALATGQAHTYKVMVNSNAQTAPLRITLVWTDPPGNPAAGIKLVNNLDLIVTNLDTSTTTNPVVYFGNTFPAGSVFTSQWDGDTNNIPSDNVNNVENVYINSPLSTNYSITVVAREVNVNAVTAHTNGIVQDYALVISSSNGEITNALTLQPDTGVLTNTYAANLTAVTNQFDTPNASGGVLLGQHVGANSPLQGTNSLSLTNQADWSTNGAYLGGVSNQWHFYVVTNAMGTNATESFTNAAFITFLPVELSIPPVGVTALSVTNATRPEADIDLYVARGATASGLTNLDPAELANATKSLSRGGTETIVFSNAQPNEVFYIGVKSEDQEAAEYAFAALFSRLPFSQMGPNGEEYLQGINVPTPIPDGTPNLPGTARTLALAVQPIQVRRVVVTNILQHQNLGDLTGTLSHDDIPVVLNNHTFGANTTNAQELIYEDNGEGDTPGSQHSDGPGALTDFIGSQGVGLWLLTEQDNALFNTGQVDNVFIKLDPQLPTNGIVATIQPGKFFYDYVDVPPNCTNLTVNVSLVAPSPGPVQLYVQYGQLPTTNSFDYTTTITSPPGSGSLTITRNDLPPLRPGRYYIGVFNPTSAAQTIRLSWTLGLDPNGAIPTPITSTNSTALLPDDAVTNNTISITNTQPIVEVNVGVVLQHPRISDLDMTLVSPTGQRILLFENRGGEATNMGHLNIFTNFFGSTSAGDARADTNTLAPVPNSGTLIIDYDFFTIPDKIDVYYQGQDIFSTTVNSNGTFTIPYGPGTDNKISIVMNQGNNPVESTAWTYTPRVVTEDFTYMTFTDDTNVTDIPIKFALTPYDTNQSGTNIVLSDFELASNGQYIASPAVPITNIFDQSGGWTMTTNDFLLPTNNNYRGTNLLSMATNEVSVVADPGTAGGGTNYLALANGSISRNISLTPGRDYTINYLYRGPGITGWWRGEGNGSDSSDPELYGNNGDLIGRFNFPAGEVGQAFAFEDSGLAFQFAGTNTYVQVRQSRSLDVGAGSGFTVEGWINPTNINFQQPLVEWLAHVPTNTIVNGQTVSNLVITAGPFLNRANGHYYYLLGQTNWTTSELWANALGGHLAEVDDANEENWIYDTFAEFGGTNYTMWIGLTNSSTLGTNLIWSSGNSNVVYTNWAGGEPTNCSGKANYTAILGPTNALPGLWTVLDNNGVSCDGAANKPFGVVEVDDIQTNGVQFWISVTNTATNGIIPGNGRLYANIIDTNSVSHEIYSPPGLIQSNVFQHVALTYDTNSGVATLYYNGTNVTSTNLGVFVPKTGGDLLIGKDMSRVTNNFFWGRMDEMSVYSRFLSPAEIAAIYRISATTSNRNIGKFDPSISPAESLAEAQVSFGGTTNLILGDNQNWQVQGFSLRATSNSLPLQITGLEPGMLLDSFNLAEKPPGNLFYLPEEALKALVGESAFGNWTLEIRDARTGAVSTNAQLISWQLQFILQTNIAPPVVLSPQTQGTNTVPPGQIAYFLVQVPSWASFATNRIVSATAPVDLLFNQANPPGTGSPGDFTLLNNTTAGASTLAVNPPTTPPLVPGSTYYLGVRNNGSVPSTVVVEVDFNITTLTNGIPITSVLNTNEAERPFVFNVSSNATEATFQLLQLHGGNADLVLRKGLPLPNLLSADYGSFSGSNADETIYVLTNSLPVPLSAGPWYLDVIKRDASLSNAVSYAVLAKELDQPPAPTIINLTNRVPLNYTAGPGAALTNFFKFSVTNFPLTAVTNLGVHFEIYNQTGNGDLTVQTNALPLAPQFLQTSRLPGNNAEIIFIHTNSAFTNLNADWYLGVPNNETNPISFTILAQIDTNGFPAFPTAEGAGSSTRGGALGTNVYHVTTLFDSGPGSLRAAVTSTNSGTVVFDVSGTINLTSPLFITNSFMTIAGQTAPSNGVTVAGATTYVKNAHDIILRYLRFRPNGTNVRNVLEFTNVANLVADHISATYGTNDVVSVLNATNLTLQWSVIAESFNKTNMPSGGTEIRYGSGDVTLHHNLYADNYSGNPTIGDDVSLDFVNNVVFNWGIFSGFSTNDLADNPGGLTNFLNYSANYLIAGPNSLYTNLAFWGGSSNTWIFQTNNFIDTNLNNIVDGANISWGMFSNRFTAFSHPFAIPPTAPDEAFIAYERVLDFAGSSMFQRDALDRGIVQRTRLRSANAPVNSLLSGMVAWWPAEGNLKDVVGSNNATGGIGYTNGEVGKAFLFDGNTNYLKVPASSNIDIGTGNGITIEGWIKPDHELWPLIDTGIPLLEWATPAEVQVDFWVEPQLRLFGGVKDTSLNVQTIESAVGAISTNRLQHVAFTYDKSSGEAFLYVNGIQITNANFGTVTPLTTGDLYLGKRIVGGPGGGVVYNGILDEIAIYKRALSPCEIAAIFNAGHAGKQSILALTNTAPTNALPYLDTDRDGIPDFWETTLNENPTNYSPNLDRDGDGYSDLEEYMNWLGVPHALTITNTQVVVDLYALSGNTGNLLFGVANGTNGTVYLTNANPCAVSGSGSIAIFTPTNNFGYLTNGGFASFTYMVTNTDTMAYFGPVTVSVFVSSVPITYASPATNTINFTNPPIAITTNEMKLLTVTNSAIDSDPSQFLTYSVLMLIDTNAMIANGWPLTYVSTNPSPVIDANGVITWTPSESQGPGVYIITTVATDNSSPPVSATNSFTVTVNEVNLPPAFVATPPDQTNFALTTMTVPNPATDPDIPPNPLTYTLLNPPAGATIDNNGTITWTPTLAQAPGVYTFTTVVSDTNAYALFNNVLSATNTFTVTVPPLATPLAFTQPAQAVTGTSAKLNGMATPNGLPSVAWFEWGTNTTYGNQTPPVTIGNSPNVVYVNNLITGLSLHVPYHYRLVVSNVFAVSVGFDQLLDEANVVAWGADYVKQAEVPPGLSNVVAIAGAYDHSLALKNNETVVAWGDNTFTQTNVPPGLNNILAVAGGQYSSMALRNNGTVAAWGGNILSVTNVPPGLNNVVMIAGGTYASLALQSSGNVVAWGANFFGVTNVPVGLNNVVEVAGGSYHSLAIRNDGTVVAWGDNSAGQTNVPPSATNVVAIAGGNYHSLALRADGTVVAWGDDSAGQTNVPPGLSNVIAVAAGGFHSMALKDDGTVIAWGDDTAGQSSVPVGLSNVVAISSGYFHSLALTPTLLSTNPIILDLTNAEPRTNSILSGSTVFYRVNVPTNVDFATNGLLFSVNGLLNVWFTTNTPPTISSTNDFLMFTNTASGTDIITAATSPQLVPGTTYYLGVQNTNGFTTAYAVEVDFHFYTNSGPPLTNAPPISTITQTNENGTNGFLLVWYAPTNDLFKVQWRNGLTGPWGTFTNIVGYHTFINPTNSEFEFFDDGSQSGGLSPFRFYRLILLNPPGSGIPVLTGGSPSTNTAPPGSLTFFQVNVPTNADFDTNSLLPTASGPLNIWFSTNNPPSITSPNDLQLMTNVTTGASIFGPATTPQLVPGSTYYIGVQNTNLTSSIYVLQVDFHLSTNAPPPNTNAPPISTITKTNINGTNAFTLIWYAPTNDLFKVQWRNTLTGGWNTFTNIVSYHTFNSPTNSEFEFLDDGSQTGGSSPTRFYNLILLNPGSTNPPPPPSTNSVPISTITATNNNGTNVFTLVWFAPTNDLFQVQWRNGLVGPWSTFTNIISYHTFFSPTNSEFEFVDDGSQTGGSSSSRFYRLILLNPSGGSPGSPSVTALVNGVPLNFTTAVGATNYFSFDITQSNASVLFELYNLTGNGDLLAQVSNLPTTPPYFRSSANPGTNYEQIVIRTNGSLQSLNAISWFLGVPNQSTNPINYTIRAVVTTNGILPSGLPLSVTASRPGGSNVQLTWSPTVDGETYQIQTNGNLVSPSWGVLTTIVVSGVTTETFTDTTPAGAPSVFYRVVQVP